MLFYVLVCLAVAIALLIAPAFVPKHPPVHPRRYCRCGRRADIMEDTWPWRVRCASCHVKHLLKQGEIL